MSKKNITFFKLSALGDVVWSIPLLRTLSQKFPGATISFVTDPLYFDLLKKLTPETRLIALKKPKTLRDYFKAIKILSQIKTDILLCGQSSWRINFLYLFIKANKKIGLEKERARDLQSLFIDDAPQGERGHQIIALFNMLTCLEKEMGTKFKVKDLKLTVSDFGMELTKDQAFSKTKNIILHPMASSRERTPPLSFWQELISQIYQRYPQYKILLSGAPQDYSFCHQIEKKFSHVENYAGKTPLPELLELFKKSVLVVAPDTGPIHLATLSGTPVIGLYVAVPPEFTGPLFHLSYCLNLYPPIYQKRYKKNPDPMRIVPLRLHGEDLSTAFNPLDVMKIIEENRLLS